MAINFYRVGGCVRDDIMGRPCNDIDYCVEANSFGEMRKEILRLGGRIFLETEKFLTIRANVNGENCDYVLCRKDGEYTDGRHPESVSPGTVYDDLARRDFTINAMALSENGKLIDPYDGRFDIETGFIRCVSDTHKKFSEDGLRILRAIRFSVVLRFHLSPTITEYLRTEECADMICNQKEERVREELNKTFRVNTADTLSVLAKFPLLRDAIFKGGSRGKSRLWLEPTLKKS